MHILAITPIQVSETELARRQARYDRLAPARMTVRLENLGEGADAPRALNTAEEIAASEAMLVRRFADADIADVDAFLPDCVLDPVFDHRAVMARPVFGIGRLTAYFLAGFGVRIGAVARNEAIAAELDRKLASYGLPLNQPTAVMNLAVEDIADDAAWSAAVVRTVSEQDNDYVINACSAVDVTPGAPGPTLLDPTATALEMIAVRLRAASA